jgi:hypothetical protein
MMRSMCLSGSAGSPYRGITIVAAVTPGIGSY